MSKRKREGGASDGSAAKRRADDSDTDSKAAIVCCVVCTAAIWFWSPLHVLDGGFVATFGEGSLIAAVTEPVGRLPRQGIALLLEWKGAADFELSLCAPTEQRPYLARGKDRSLVGRCVLTVGIERASGTLTVLVHSDAGGGGGGGGGELVVRRVRRVDLADCTIRLFSPKPLTATLLR
jgi:hypothetical protein